MRYSFNRIRTSVLIFLVAEFLALTSGIAYANISDTSQLENSSEISYSEKDLNLHTDVPSVDDLLDELDVNIDSDDSNASPEIEVTNDYEELFDLSEDIFDSNEAQDNKKAKEEKVINKETSNIKIIGAAPANFEKTNFESIFEQILLSTARLKSYPEILIEDRKVSKDEATENALKIAKIITGFEPLPPKPIPKEELEPKIISPIQKPYDPSWVEGLDEAPLTITREQIEEQYQKRLKEYREEKSLIGSASKKDYLANANYLDKGPDEELDKLVSQEKKLFDFNPEEVDTVIDVTLEEELKQKVEQDLNVPPTVILNDQRIIFVRQPVSDHGLWLFPLEEIAQKLGDQVEVDLTSGIITVRRVSDKVTAQLDIRNGLLTLNNKPFRTVFGYDKIQLGQEIQYVPASALVLLHSLTSKSVPPNTLILRSSASSTSIPVSTVSPEKRSGLRQLVADYLTATVSYNDFITADLVTRRLGLEGAGHSDDFVLTSNFNLRGGTGGAFALYDTGIVSLKKRNSLFEVHIGDKNLDSLRSPFVGGLNLRGIVVQTPGGVMDSKLVTGIGLLPSNQKVNGTAEAFLEYRRLAQFAEWSKISTEGLQYSIGESVYHDFDENVFVQGEQTGGLLTASASKSTKAYDLEANFGLSAASNRPRAGSLIIENGTDFGPGGNILLRLKPFRWLSFFGRGDFYSSEFFPLSGNSFFNDRKQITGGLNINFPKLNFNISHSQGETLLDTPNPDDFDITNITGSYKPFMNGPTFIATYSKNEAQVNPFRDFDTLLNPIIGGRATLNDVLDRRTTSFFRASIIQSFEKFNYNLSFSNFELDNSRNITVPLLAAPGDSEFMSIDLNVNRQINKILGLQSFTQISDRFRRTSTGIKLGPIFNRKLSLQTNIGFTQPKGGESFLTYSANANLRLNDKLNFVFRYINSEFREELFAILEYNIFGKRHGNLVTADPSAYLNSGKVKGRVIVQEEAPPVESEDGSITLPPKPIERGLQNIRIYFANHEYKTDRNGSFVIPSVSEGLHTIHLEYSDIPAYLASLTPESVDVIVEAGKETSFDFVLSHYGSLIGKVNLVGEAPFGIEVPEVLGDIRVYLEGTDFETLTDLDGSFELSDVKPGTYKLKVDGDFIPDTLKIVNSDGIEVRVYPQKELKDLSLDITYKEREQTIQDFDSGSSEKEEIEVLEKDKKGGDMEKEAY